MGAWFEAQVVKVMEKQLPAQSTEFIYRQRDWLTTLLPRPL